MKKSGNIVYTELCIWGHGIDGKGISKLLGLPEPYIMKKCDYSAKLGKQVFFNPGDKNYESIWTYKTNEKNVLDISESLDDLIEIFKSKTEEIKELKRVFDVRVVIEIVIQRYKISNPSIAISKEEIAFINDIEASIDFDIY